MKRKTNFHGYVNLILNDLWSDAYLGMGCEVGTTGMNFGQLAICSWTFVQDEICDRILTRVTWDIQRDIIKQSE